MKKLITLLIFIYTTLSATQIVNSFTDIENKYISSNTITLGMIIENYPFSFKEDNQISGFSYDYINLITEKSGLKIKIEIDNWENTLNKFKTKQIHIIDSISYKKSRESFTNFSKPYFKIPNVIFARKDEINNYTGLESLKGKKVGITKGIYYYKAINDLKLFELVEFTTTSDKMSALAFEKVDVVLNNLINGQKYIKQAGYSNIKILDELDSTIVKKEDLRLGIKKDATVLFSIINKTIENITQEEKEILYDKWFTAKIESKATKRNIHLTDNEKQYLKEKEEISMCIDPDWMPFEKNDKGTHIGMSADYIKLFEKSISIPIRMIPTKTWSQSLALGEKNGCDIFSLVMPTSERVKFLDFSQPYIKTPLVITTNNDALFISTLSELKGKKVGIAKDYAYAEILRKEHPEMDFIEVKDLNDGLDKVYEKELYAFIGGLATVGFKIQNNYIGQLKIAGKIDDVLELGIGSRNDEPMLNSIFNKLISEISTEEHQNILNKWVSINYEQGVKYETIWKYLSVLIVLIIIFILIYRQYLLKDLNKSLNEKMQIEIKKNKRQNEILSQQSKMVAMGEMIGNIAHQWRQPLSVITMGATGIILEQEMGTLDDATIIKNCDAINNNAQYLSKTIDDFRNFIKGDRTKTIFNLRDDINSFLHLIEGTIKKNDIKIVLEINEKIYLNGYQNELIQCFINIFNNAKDALNENNIENKFIFISTFIENDNVIITFKDNAGGIPEDIIHKVFEPYFTTKHKAQGTGLGLHITYNLIVKGMIGNIEANNTTYEYEDKHYTGAEFVITLPIS